MATELDAGEVVLPERVCRSARLVIGDDGRIESVAEDHTEPGTTRLTPGFVDLQVNGFRGIDVMTCSAAELEQLGRLLLRTGVTSFLPTLISKPVATLCSQLRVLAPALENWPADAARPLGFHLEGPFLNPRRRGAHLEDALSAASLDAAEELSEAAGGRVALVTLAPELPGALELTRELVARGIRVSVGHSDATFEQTRAAADAGATLCTHFGNAMSPLHHRAPGVPGACLLDERLFACVIPDLVHVHSAVLDLVFRVKGARGVILVTDAIAAAGLPDGEYHLAGQRVTVRDGASRDESGALAGATASLDQCAARFRGATGASPVELSLVASTNPARALGRDDVGQLAPGALADVLEWDVTAEPRLQRVWLAGRPCDL